MGTRLPVLLVHGLGGSNEGWESFLRAYERDPAWRIAFKPYTFRYSTDAGEVNGDPAAPRTIPAVAGALRDAMQAFHDRPAGPPHLGFGGKRVIVLAHSMGGLVARSMMQEHAFRDGQRGGEKVLRLVTLGTPHHGSPLMDAALALGLNTIGELSDTYSGFLAQLTWTNDDGLDMFGGRCNPWLAGFNNHAPATGGRHACDHRFIKRGYTELVRSAAGSHVDTAFCAASSMRRPCRRACLAVTTRAYVGVREGNVYYMGPASNGDAQFMGTLADFAAQAQGAGF